MSSLSIENRLPTDNPGGGIRLGLVRAGGVVAEVALPQLNAALADATGAADAEMLEARRLGARDMLRNGRYKPTGRGKPASEYLVRAAQQGAFPRINALVDVNNLLSLEARLPISLWDLDRAQADRFVFRLGAADEAYVFNASGQTLALADLVVGCRAGAGGEIPIVSPIKDSHATKTTPDTVRVAAAIYAPVSTVSMSELEALAERFAAWLGRCGRGVKAAFAVAEPGQTVEV